LKAPVGNNAGHYFDSFGDSMFLKKTTLAAACLLAAFTAQAEVTVYGVLDLSFGSYQRLSVDPVDESVSSQRRAGVESGDMTASFIGFKGEEDLGSGLKAVFNIESYVKADTGAQGSTAFWGRNTHVGISSNELGTLTIGHTDTLYFQHAVAFNPFGASGQYSPTVRLAMAGALGDVARDLSDAFNLPVDLGDISLYGSGWSNAITYTSPNVAGFVGAVQFGLKEDGAETQGRMAVSGAYTAGPLGLSVVFANDKYAQDSKLTSVLGGVSYDLGAAKLYGQLGQHTIKDAGVLAGGDSYKVKFFQLGAGIPVTAEGAVLVSVGQSKLDGSLKVRDFSIAYDQALSKRTDAYIGLRDERFSGEGDSAKQNALSAGVRHRF
jgi:predicted porin